MVWEVLLDIVLLLAGALVLGGIFSRLGQSALVGYLLAGMLMGGPGSVQVIRFEKDVEAVAELGVSLLLFSLGLEFSWQRLRHLGLRTLLGGVAQVVLTCATAALAATLFGLGGMAAFAVGAMVALSSTACVLRVLMERGELDSVHGRNALGILLVQDMAVVPLAVLLAVLAGGGSVGRLAFDLGRTIVLAAVLVGVLHVVLKVVAVRLLGVLTLEKNRELAVLLAVATGLGSAWAAHGVGLSPALGAFVAGMFLGGSPFATQIRADIAALRVVLLTLFFGAAGMVANPLWMLANWQLVVGVTVLLMTGKVLIVWGVLRVLGQTTGNALATGVSLAQLGEFAFVLGGMALKSGAIAGEDYLVIVSSAFLSLSVTPFCISAAPRIGTWVDRLRRRRVEGREPADEPRHGPEVIIVGFGPAGEAVGRTLSGSGRDVLVLDLNVKTIRHAESLGLRGSVGDASHADVLEHAHVESAQLVVITVPGVTAAAMVLKQVRSLAPQAHVVVRTRYQRHRVQFESSGAHAVIGDEQAVGEGLASYVTEHLGEAAR